MAYGGKMARVGARFEVFGGKLRGHGRGEFANRFPVFDKGVQVFSGVGVLGRSKNAAIAQRAGAELHAALHPGDDAVILNWSTAAPSISGVVESTLNRSLQFSRTCLISAALKDGPKQ